MEPPPLTYEAGPSGLVVLLRGANIDYLHWAHKPGQLIKYKFDVPVYTTDEIYIKALRLLNLSGCKKRVSNLVVSVYNLVLCHSEQLKTFAQRSDAVVEAMDKINDKYGDFTLTPALMMDMDDTIIDRIAFGSVKELEELYQQ